MNLEDLSKEILVSIVRKQQETLGEIHHKVTCESPQGPTSEVELARYLVVLGKIAEGPLKEVEEMLNSASPARP
jgi:hypothetical protein